MDHLCWKLIIPRLSFSTQLKLSQMNNDLGLIAIENGNFEMKRLIRRLKNNPYLARKNGRKNENGRNWTFWRALNWILEEETNHFDLVQVRFKFIALMSLVNDDLSIHRALIG